MWTEDAGTENAWTEDAGTEDAWTEYVWTEDVDLRGGVQPVGGAGSNSHSCFFSLEPQNGGSPPE